MGFLDGMVGGRGGFQPGMMRGAGGGMSFSTKALLALLAYRTMKGKGRLADMTGIGGADGFREPSSRAIQVPVRHALSGGALAEGLADLVARFQQTPYADRVQSWIGTGENKEISTRELERALGESRIEWLMVQTGKSRAELLEGLSQTLPDAIDSLTPAGKLPDAEEAERLL
ncbi:MAG TPA: YidB family protein [Patescibacteria group bacterium]|nr:YidB family protein [Patescibacteria group bacterium]